MPLLQVTHGYYRLSSNCMGIRIALLGGKGCNSFKTGGKNLYEIVNFLKPIYRLKHPYALKKIHCRKTHFLSPVQKKIFPYYGEITDDTGLVQQPDKIVARYALTDLSLFVRRQAVNHQTFSP